MTQSGFIKNKFENYPLFIIVFCLFLSSLFLLIATQSSPLYPFNDWVDANASFTMGKGLMNGKVLYKDIFDHKGPLLHFTYGLGYLISKTSFVGVFIFEVLSLSIFLFFSFKILSLYLDIEHSLIALPMIAAAVLNLENFAQGGSAEEFCLPMVAISLYYFLKYFKDIYPEPLHDQWPLINGVIAGFVLWIKFSLLGFWLGWVLSMFICISIKNGFLRAIRGALIFAGGMLVATIPWLIYFGINHAIFEWINSYFIFNIISYSRLISFKSMFIFSIIGVFIHLPQNPDALGFLYFGLIFFITHKKFTKNNYIRLGLISLFFFLALSVYGGGRGYDYYFLIFSPFILFGFIVMFSQTHENLENYIKENLLFITLVILIVAFSYTRLFHHNINMIGVGKDDLVQYRYTEFINKFDTPTLLNYGALDGGFYTTTGIVPNNKFFYKPNIDHLKFPLILGEQNRYIENQVVDFVVVWFEPSNASEILENPYLSKNYSIVKSEYQIYEGKVYKYLPFMKRK